MSSTFSKNLETQEFKDFFLNAPNFEVRKSSNKHISCGLGWM